MTDDRELSAVLRDGMAAQAREISASSAFTEQLIRTSTQAEDRAGRGWRNWMLPLAAAVLVAFLVSSALIGGKLLHASRHQSNGPLGPQPTSSAPGTPKPSPTGSSSPSSAPTTAPAGPVGPSGGPVPAGFRAVDLTWVSLDQGWALGTAPCGNPPCTSIVRTSDGGQHWVGIPAPVAGLQEASDCTGSQACIGGLRFANSQVGYAYGMNSLFLTTDGGQHWQRLSGGAYGLEIANGSVLRVISNCLPGCPYRMQRATVGTDSWTTVSTLAGAQTSGAELVRNGHLAALLTMGHIAGGAQHATSVLFTSTDDGADWTARGEPCPQGSTEVDSTAVTIAPDRSITLLCALRGAPGGHFTATSTDGGLHFTAARMVLGAATGNVLGAASATNLLVSLDQLYLSTDGGANWRKVDQLPAGPGGPAEAIFIGFESGTVGRLLDPGADSTVGASQVWTTTDAGRSWTMHSFG
jgi:photosystem II stability/assembly factor-like uncharacterized protein